MPPCPPIRSAVNSLVSRLAPRPRPPPSSPPPRCDLDSAIRNRRSYATTQQERQRDDTYWLRLAFSKPVLTPQKTDGRKKSIDYSAYEAVLESNQGGSELQRSEESFAPAQRQRAPTFAEESDGAPGDMPPSSDICMPESAQNDAESTVLEQERFRGITHIILARAKKRRTLRRELRHLRRTRNPSAASLRRATRTRSAYAIYKRNGVWAFEALPKPRRKMTWSVMSKDQRRRVEINRRLVGLERKGLTVQTQMLSLAPHCRSSATFSTGWSTQFARVSQLLDKTSLAQLRRRSLRALEPQTHILARLIRNHACETWPLGMADLEIIAERLDTATNQLWAAIALWKLVVRPRGIVKFLLETHTPPYPPINWVEDCLQFAAMRVRKVTTLSDKERKVEARKLLQAFPKLVARETGEQMVIDSSFIAILLSYASSTTIHDVWDLIKAGKLKVRWPTLLRLARSFLDRNFFDKALDATLQANKSGLNVNSKVFLSFCSLLLRRSMSQKEGLRVTLRIIENMVGIGVKLNRQLCNIVMLNAIEAGDHGTMSAVHQSAIEQGLEPNEYTYAILLKACKQDIGNGNRLREVIQAAIASGHVRRDAVVATEVLHCLALHHTREVPKGASDDPYRPFDRVPTPTAVNAVLEAYCQLFDPAPLERIGITMPHARALDPEHPRLSPGHYAITIIMAVYLEQPLRTEHVVDCYTRWRQLAEGGDKELLACVGKTHLSNTFLRKFCRKRATLMDAARVVKDMQRPLDPNPSSTHGIQQAKPDVYTWSIFLDGFARNGQTKLAEQVMAYMRKKGIEPNHVTWTSLLGGYARAQDGEKVLYTLRKIEASGAAVNELTRVQLRRFRDRDRLRSLMVQHRYGQNLDFTTDIRQGLVDKINQADDEGVDKEQVTASKVVEGTSGDSAGDIAHASPEEGT